jgi:antitoxin ParD1/3/4
MAPGQATLVPAWPVYPRQGRRPLPLACFARQGAVPEVRDPGSGRLRLSSRPLAVNATEVIRDAIRRMQAEESRVAAWQAAIKVGGDQLNRGEGIAYSPEAMNDITQSAISAMHSGTPMDADVLP